MAYNMQVAFATTVVGLVIAAVGIITLQVKQPRKNYFSLGKIINISELINVAAFFAFQEYELLVAPFFQAEDGIRDTNS